MANFERAEGRKSKSPLSSVAESPKRRISSAILKPFNRWALSMPFKCLKSLFLFIVYLSVCLSSSSIRLRPDWSVDQLVGQLVGQLDGQLVGWSVGWLHWLVSWLVGWSFKLRGRKHLADAMWSLPVIHPFVQSSSKANDPCMLLIEDRRTLKRL